MPRAQVNAVASGGGSIAINAQNLNLAIARGLQAAINPGLGFTHRLQQLSQLQRVKLELHTNDVQILLLPV